MGSLVWSSSFKGQGVDPARTTESPENWPDMGHFRKRF